jgi:phytoene dehydrogenase-like protein
MAFLRQLRGPFGGRRPPAAGGYAIRDGRRHTLPAGAYSLMTTGLLPLPSKVEAAGLLARLGRVGTGRHDSLSVADWLHSEIRRPDVRELLSAFIRVATYAHDAERQSAGAALAQLQRAAGTGVVYLDGGWQTLVDGLRQVAEAAGAVVADRSGVAELERCTEAPFRLRLTGGGWVTARSVVVATSPAEAAALLGSLAPETRGWRAAAVPVRVAALDLALRRLPRPAATFALGIDQPLYASVHTAAARLAPEGGAVLHVARYLGACPDPDTMAVEAQLVELAELLQPGWQEEVVARRFLPDLTVSHALVRADRGGLVGRPGPRVPSLAGVFVAGDWVGPQGMLADAAVASAREAARLAIVHVKGSGLEL